MRDRPWGGFNAVDESDDPDYHLRYLDELRSLGDTREYKERSFDLLCLEPGGRALDVGCGTGHDALELARRVTPGGQAVGVDPSRYLVEEARRRASMAGLPAEFHIGDAYRLPFPDGSFDACRSDRVFLYLERPVEALAEMVRVSRPGGMVYVRDPDMQTYLLDSPDRRVTRRIVDYLSDSFNGGWVGRQLPRLFQEAGITRVECHPRTLVVRSLGELDALFALRRTVAGAVASGAVTTAEGEAWLADLEAADRQGRFTFSLTFFETFGRKP